MNQITDRITNFFNRYVPSPFSITVILTFLTFVLAFVFTTPTKSNIFEYGEDLLYFWRDGIWNHNLLVFAYQMMLILVLGHALVLSKPMQRFIANITKYCTNSSRSALIVSLTTMIFAFFNWGLALIFGALFAREIGANAERNNIKINYPLIGAAGYMGMLVWHGGISGSAPIKITESQHLQSLVENSNSDTFIKSLPEYITFKETIFSTPNLITFLVVTIITSIVFYWLGKKAKEEVPINLVEKELEEYDSKEHILDRTPWLGIILAVFMGLAFVITYGKELNQFKISPNLINLFLFALALLFHGSLHRFFKAVQASISDISDILIQFPLYFGIMGVMQQSGLVSLLSDQLITIANEQTLPLFVFVSSGIVNFFIPSGGGQWVVQGPIILEAAHEIGVPYKKVIMALAYGDQVTNLLQPFWALPLLGITKLKAKQILPYTLLIFMITSVIYLLSLVLLW